MSLGPGGGEARPGPLQQGEGRWTVGFQLPRALGWCAVFAALGLVIFLFSVRFGEQPVSLRSVFIEPVPSDVAIFWALRVPRALLAAMVGAGLAASGATLQGVMRNALAEPFVLGVSGGAALGATVALAMGLATLDQVAPGMWTGLARQSAPTLFAFVGAGLSLLFVLSASRGYASRAPYAVLLTGTIFNTLAAALITLVKVLSAPDRLGELLHWLVGNLEAERGSTLALSGLLQVGAVGVMWVLSGRLNLLTLGDADATALGVPVERTRRLLLVTTSASVAGAVALSGLIGFVGLIVPHVLRLLFGPDQRLLVPLSALGGAAFLLLSDLLSRVVYPLFGRDLPVGVVTALLGGSLFLVLLRRRLRGESVGL